LRRIQKIFTLTARAIGQLENSIVAVIKEKGRAQMSLQRYDEAEATLAELAMIPGRFVEAEELTAFLLLEKARNRAGTDLNALRQIAGEIRDMSIEHEGSDNLKFMYMELRTKLGEDDERAAICEDLYEEELVDPEFRVWRAWISFIFVEYRKRKFFDREQPEDMDVDLKNQWTDLEAEMEFSARRAADDLAVVGLHGFDRLDGIFRDAVMAEFLLGAMQSWAGEPRQAAAIFTRLEQREEIDHYSWAPLMFALHGHALEKLGLVDQALSSYRLGLSKEQVDDWCLSRAPRLAARKGRWQDLAEILALVKEKQPHVFWLKNELNHIDYERARREGKLP
jgi:tetratricopeptide (TPR) repeat protein